MSGHDPHHHTQIPTKLDGGVVTRACPSAGDKDFTDDVEDGAAAVMDSTTNATTESDGDKRQSNGNVDYCSKRSKIWIAITILLVLLAGIGVGLYFYFISDSQNVEGSRQEQLQSLLIETGVNVKSDFEDPQSPQSKALQFIAFEDQLELQIPSSSKRRRKENDLLLDTEEGYALLTRYALTVLYFTTNGRNDWVREMNFLASDLPTCEWYERLPPPLEQGGISCHPHTNQIASLSFVENNLNGSLPKELGFLTSLEYMELIGNNHQSTTIPETWSQLSNLRSLVIIRGQLIGQLPTFIGNLPNLEHLYLSNNMFEGKIPSTYKNLNQLVTLAFDDNLLQGSFDDDTSFIFNDSIFSNMEYVYLEDNTFQGQLPTSLAKSMPNLIHLDLSSNKVQGQLPQDIFELSQLQIVDLSDNSLIGPLPVGSGGIETKLKFLALHHNNLSGTITDTLGTTLSSLQHLDLSNNAFQGNIPDLSGMTNLEYFYLSNNPSLTSGNIPYWWLQNLAGNLKELSLKNTNLIGRFSNMFEKMISYDKLVLLDLDNNMLTGVIPANIQTMLPQIQFLLLNRNQLSGVVPDFELNALSNLRALLLDRNDMLTGSLDMVCSNQVNSIELVIANCDRIFCSCCNCGNGETNHSYESVSNTHPVWELGYNRQFYSFSETVTGEEAITFGVGDDDVLMNAPVP